MVEEAVASNQNQYLLCLSRKLKPNQLGFQEIKKKKKKKMSYLLPHLHSGWAVDQAILAEEERLVIIRFGHDWDETCMQVISILYREF